MPYKPYWLQRLPEIIEQLKELPVDTIDRPTFQAIFGLRRRRAIELMHSLGSHRGGRGFVLDRAALVKRLKSFDMVTQYHWEEQVRLECVVMHRNGTGATTAKGSNGNHLGPRRVLLEFWDEAELTKKLLALLRAACDGHGTRDGLPGEPHAEVQYSRFDLAIQALRKGRFYEAQALFAQACAGPNEKIRTSAETYLRICRNRTEKPFDPTSFEDHYTYGVALLNERRLPEARTQLESAIEISPSTDYLYYALAACCALSGDMAGAYSNLRRAIQLQPRNRIAVWSDPDFQEALKDCSIRRLLDGSSYGISSAR